MYSSPYSGNYGVSDYARNSYNRGYQQQQQHLRRPMLQPRQMNRSPYSYGYGSGYGQQSSMFSGLGGNSYGYRRGVGSGVGSVVGTLALGVGALAWGTAKLTGSALVSAGKGIRGFVVDYCDKYKHEKEFCKLAEFRGEFKCTYDCSDTEFGHFMTEHKYANLDPYSAVEFTVETKYGKDRASIYLPGDPKNTGLGEDSEGEVVCTRDDWLDMLCVPEEQRQFFKDGATLEFTITRMIAYYVAPRKQMVKAENPNCVGLLLRSEEAVSAIKEIANTAGRPQSLMGVMESLRVGYVVMIPDLAEFFDNPAVRALWAKVNPYDADGSICLEKVQSRLDAHQDLPAETGIGVTCTNHCMFGRPRQKLPAADSDSKKRVRKIQEAGREYIKKLENKATEKLESVVGKAVDGVKLLDEATKVPEPVSMAKRPTTLPTDQESDVIVLQEEPQGAEPASIEPAVSVKEQVGAKDRAATQVIEEAVLETLADGTTARTEPKSGKALNLNIDKKAILECETGTPSTGKQGIGPTSASGPAVQQKDSGGSRKLSLG